MFTKGKWLIIGLFLGASTLVGGVLYIIKWHDSDVAQAKIDGFNACLDSVVKAPPKLIDIDTTMNTVEPVRGESDAIAQQSSINLDSVASLIGKKDSAIAALLRTQNSDTTFRAQTTATDSTGRKVKGIVVSGSLDMTYNPLTRKFGHRLVIDPIPQIVRSYEKVVERAYPECPMPPWFAMTGDFTIGGRFSDPVFNFEKKGYAFTLTPIFANGRVLSVAVPVGFVMLQKQDKSNDYTRTKLQADAVVAVQLRLMIFGRTE